MDLQHPKVERPPSGNRSIYVSLACELIITIAKFIAAAVSGSSAMAAEGIHSAIDTASNVLMLWGVRKSYKEPDEDHPFGHGKEIYFWTLIVALIMFVAGGGVTIYEGVLHIVHGAHMEVLRWNYFVLGLAAIFETITVATAFQEFRLKEGRSGTWNAIQKSKDPTTFTVLVSNLADLVGIFIAFLGIALARVLNRPWLDGCASVLIGILLAVVAIVLAIEIKGLLIGEGLDKNVLAEIRELVGSDSAIDFVGRPFSMYVGPDNVLLAIEVQFRNSKKFPEIAEVTDRLERAIRRQHPEIKKIFIEAKSFDRYRPPSVRTA